MTGAESRQKSTWIQKGFALLFIIFCMELGVFLAFYPWTDQWMQSFVPGAVPPLRNVWLSGYFRGLVSGVGILNLWIALSEIFRLRRFSSSPPTEPAER